MKLSQLAEKSGYSVSTIYDYLKSGLLHRPIKDGPTRSEFDQSHLDRLNRIRILKRQKISLVEIRKMLSANDEKNGDTSEAVKQQIVDKALELFSKRHYENTRISDITGALNMGSGTFYRYFKSKEELFLECLERLPGAMVPREAWEDVDAETDIIGRLKKRGYAMFNAFPSYTGILDYAKLSLASENRNLAKKAAECIKSLVHPLQHDLERFMAEGTIRKVDAELMAYLLLGINETFFHRMLIDSKYSVDEGFDIIEDLIAHALSATAVVHQPRPAEKHCFLLTDTKGNEVSLSGLRINGFDFLEGGFLEGALRIQVDEIDDIVVSATNEGVEAQVTSLSGTRINLKMDPEDLISGQTGLGEFKVQISKISRLLVGENG